MARILFATSEARPLIKTGGLADVSGALPAALNRLGTDCRLLVPGYHSVMTGVRNLKEIWYFQDFQGYGEVRLHQGLMPDSGVPVYVVDCPWHYLREGGPYQDIHGKDYPDSAWRFALLSRVAALLAGPTSPLDWRPQLLHCHDWQTGLAPAYLRFAGGGGVPSIMTIHNLAYQGIFPPDHVVPLGLPQASFLPEGVEYYGNLSFLKTGLYYADWITTVSPSYAKEIQFPAMGMGMQGLLSTRKSQLTGILNGIDTDDWNPAEDRHLPCKYSHRNSTGKLDCKLALQRDLNLEVDAEAPLFGVISRLTYQKGLDWILQVANGILDRGGQIALLGTGDKALETAFRDLAAHHPGRVVAVIGYDEGLSHRIEAGADIFLMPSRFEPCGLNQMYSLRYGTVPIVHATGGLRDTVEDGVTGFVFHQPEAHALWQAIERALYLWGKPKAWRKMMLAGMHQDYSWDKSAQEYVTLYESLVTKQQSDA
jgi:starch synthase